MLNINKLQKFRNLNLQLIGIKIFGLISPINHNLAAMAKQLYDYWFVQFDFPNQDGKPYKSNGGKMVWNEKLKREIPEGWNAKRIDDSSISSIQIYYDIQPFIKAKEKSLKGSTVGHLLDKDLKELYILNSNTNLRNIFDYILLKILTGKIEYETLTKQRDELLPLLMNGQARIG